MEAEFTSPASRPATGRLSAGLRYVTPVLPHAPDPGALGRFADSDTVTRWSPLRTRLRDGSFRREPRRPRAIAARSSASSATCLVLPGPPADPELFYVAAQNVTMAPIWMSLVVRTTTTEAPLMPAIRAAIADVNPRLAISPEKTMAQVIDDSQGR